MPKRSRVHAVSMMAMGVACSSPHAAPFATQRATPAAVATSEPSAARSAWARDTSPDNPPSDEAIEGHLRCVYPQPPYPTKSLEQLGTSFTGVYGGESFCALDGTGQLWCGHERTRDTLVRHPVPAPVKVSVTRDGYCAVDASDNGACLVVVPATTGGRPVPTGHCTIRLPGIELVSIHRYDAQLTAGMPFNFYLCVAHAKGDTSCLRRLFQRDAVQPYGLGVPEPTRVGGLAQVRALALPSSCALEASGSVKCWVKPHEINWSGPQHGLPPGSDVRDIEGVRTWQPKATQLGALTEVVDLQSGLEHACALDRSGAVTCWGRNEVRQLGFKMALPPPTYEAAPALVVHSPTKVRGVGRASKLAVGALHTCVERNTGGAICWGHNDQGQLGSKRDDCHAAGHVRGLTARCAGPSEVPQLTSVRALSAQGNRTAFVSSTGALGWITP